MIQHDVDVAQLDEFDWLRDMLDTFQWLRNEGRLDDAAALMEADRANFYRKHKNRKATG
tara:strand:+ start:2770 stop:2946 length:177 start_codon:yes stop_codon:yes gene_type:complete